jgi:hypothetical protein
MKCLELPNGVSALVSVVSFGLTYIGWLVKGSGLAGVSHV